MGLDLIYMTDKKEDVGIMKDYTFDLAFGTSENNFECKIIKNNHCLEKGYFLYIEDTEYGGIVDDIGVNSERDEITYSGRTWHGILNSKVIEPPEGKDYLIVEGEANSVLGLMIEAGGLSSLFKSSNENSGIVISNYKMHRYIRGYDGVRKMLRAFGAKLNISFEVENDEGFVVLSAKPLVDYSKNEQFDNDQIDLNIVKKYNPVNHVICLGAGELANREVIHVYADRNGEISEIQVFTGIDEVADIYENVNATGEELKQGGIDKIKEAWSSDELDFNFNSIDESFDIGDIVGAYENITGTEVAKEITKKIVNISNNNVTVSYPSDKGSSIIYPIGGGNVVTIYDDGFGNVTISGVTGIFSANNLNINGISVATDTNANIVVRG